MKQFYPVAISVMAAVLNSTAGAVEVPTSGRNDARVRYVEYQIDNVVQVDVRPGNITRIVLESDEVIDIAASGFPADCKVADLEWCIVANKGQSQIWVKPLRAATHNNLEVKTDKRDYSFEFRVLPEAQRGRWTSDESGKKAALASEPMARVIFSYPKPKVDALPPGLFDPAPPRLSDAEKVKDLFDVSAPEVRNWNYTVKVGDGAEGIKPELVFDDGRFTYFKYPKNRQVPAIFAINSLGEESRLNFAMEDNELVAVHRLSQQYVLRQGDAVVGIWNESFDGDGVAIQNGVTVDGVARELK